MQFGDEHISIIYNLLPKLLDSNSTIQRESELQFNQWSVMPGFCTLLLKIGSSPTVDTSLRNFAILCLKNVAGEQWTAGGRNNIHPDEKVLIRKALLELIVTEQSSAIATQLSLLIAVISRNDFPKEWPILNILAEIVSTPGSMLTKKRGLLCLRHVVRALMSKCLPISRKSFREIAPNMFSFCFSIWSENSNIVFSSLKNNQDNNDIVNCSELVILSLKIIQCLLIQGFDQWNEENYVLPFFRVMLERWKENISMIDHVQTHLPSYTKFMESCSKLFGKIIVATQEKYPFNWSNLLLDYIQFCTNVIQNNSTNSRLLIDCMKFLKGTLVCTSYTSHVPAYFVIKEIGNEQYINNMVVLLVGTYIPLSKSDLEHWNEDPEEFVLECETDSFDENVRTMAENLFLSLYENELFESTVAQTLLNLSNQTANSGTNVNELILKSAVYTTIGHSSHYLYSLLDFSGWFHSKLIPELQNCPHPNHIIVQKSVLQMIGQWAHSIQREILPQIYEIIAAFLEHTDLVVALTAVQVLVNLIHPSKFDIQLFMPYFPGIMERLFKLVDTAKEEETKQSVLQLISAIVEQSGSCISPCSMKILELSCQRWNHKNCSTHMKLTIIRLLVSLIKNSDEVEFQSYVIPLIKYSTSVVASSAGMSEIDDILADGILLWLSTLKNCNTYTSEMNDLFPNLKPILAQGFFHVELCFKIIENYILLGGITFLNSHYALVIEILTKLVDDVIEEMALPIMKVTDVLLLILPHEGVPGLYACLKKILISLLSDKDSLRLMSHYVTTLSRLLLHHKDNGVTFFNQLSLEVIPQQNLLKLFLLKIEDKIEYMNENLRKKVVILSLLELMKEPSIVEDDELINGCFVYAVITAIDLSIIESDTDEGPAFKVVPESNECDDEELYITETKFFKQQQKSNKKEWRKIYLIDPINGIPTKSFLTQILQFLQTNHPNAFQKLISQIPQELLLKFQQLQ